MDFIFIHIYVLSVKYKPVGRLNETVVAGAEFGADSALIFMSLLEEKKIVEDKLQEARENKFLNENMAMDVSVDDIDTSNLELNKKQLDNIDSINIGIWDNIIEDCYSFRDSREPEEPLDRVTSISENVKLPSVDTTTLRFDADKARVTNIDGDEAIEIHFNTNTSIILFIDSENIEFYQGMYEPPITQDLDTLKGQIENFDEITIRNNTDIGKELMSSAKPKTVKREVTNTEVILSNKIETNTYLPEPQIMDNDDNPGHLEDVRELEKISDISSWESKRCLMETLEEGYLISEKSLKLLEILYNDKNIPVSYSYIASPRYLEEFGRLTDSELIHVPQDELLIFGDEDFPKWIKELDNYFPEKNELSESERNSLYNHLDVPSFIDPNIEWREQVKSKEILLGLFEDQEIAQDHIVSYYLVPWDCIKPERECVKKAIEYGEDLRSTLKKVDKEYELDIYNSTVVWEQRKVYKKGNFSTD